MGTFVERFSTALVSHLAREIFSHIQRRLAQASLFTRQPSSCLCTSNDVERRQKWIAWEVLTWAGVWERWNKCVYHKASRGNADKRRFNRDVRNEHHFLFDPRNSYILLNPHRNKLIKVMTLKVISIDLPLMMRAGGRRRPSNGKTTLVSVPVLGLLIFTLMMMA